MSWQRYRRRYRLRQAVLRDVAVRGAVSAVDHWRPDIDVEYGNLAGFLCDVRVHWERTEQTRVEAALETGESTDAARAQLAGELWPVRALLDACARPPELLSARRAATA